MGITNKKILTEGYRIASLTPVDDRFVYSNIAELVNYGTSDQECYRFYEGLKVWVIDTESEYVWREVVGSETGVGADFTYPAGIEANGINYGGRTFNFFVIEANSLGANSYANNHVLTAGVPETITHNLNSSDIIIQITNGDGELTTPTTVNNYTTNSVDVWVSASDNYRVMILKV